MLVLLTIGGDGRAPDGFATAPPAGRAAHGAAGTARNGFGGEIAPSPTGASWPGTGGGGNGGPFAFIGAHYGPLWGIPAGPNNMRGVGYCIMEDVAGEGAVAERADPAAWDVGEMARAGALMSTFGGDRVVPYGIDARGAYDAASGEWQVPALFGGGEYTRRRQVAVNFGVKMFVEDASPSGAVAGRKLARDTAVVNGSGGEFAALRAGYAMAQHMATVADHQHAVGGVSLAMVWSTPDGAAPTTAGSHPLEVRATDATGKPVGFVPVLQLSATGIDGNRSVGATAVVDRTRDSADDTARWNAAAATGWPTWDMGGSMAADPRFALTANPLAADVTDATGVARFTVTVPGPAWELAFHTQAPTADVSLYSGTGVQGQITWGHHPQSASTHQAVTPPPPPPPPPPPAVGEFRVRKMLDRADIQADRDMSGFTFEVSLGDGSKGATLVTGSSGLTAAFEAEAGEYTIVEVGRPPWARTLGDGGPVTFTFDPAATPDVVEVEYRNIVPDASIDTAVRDPRDGDRMVMFTPVDAPGDATGEATDETPGETTGEARLVDTVTYEGLVPGTAYVARGELLLTNSVDAAIGTGIIGSTSFTPTTPTGSVEVEFAVPASAGLLGSTAVVFQRIEVATSGRVVATHHDPAAIGQTVRFPTITTRLQPDWPAGDGGGGDDDDDGNGDGDAEPATGMGTSPVQVDEPLVDVITYAGFQPGVTYRAELTLHQRTTEGSCAPTDVASAVEFTPTASSGVVEVHGVAAPTAGTFVAFERIVAVVDPERQHDDAHPDDLARPDDPEPDALQRDDPEPDDTEPGFPLVAVHADCDEPAQTVQALAPPPPPPPPTSTTTTTPPTTTSPPTTTPPTTTVPTTSTTSVPSTTTIPPTTTVPRSTPPLPRTGSGGQSSMITAAIALLLMGAGLTLLTRPPRASGASGASASRPSR